MNHCFKYQILPYLFVLFFSIHCSTGSNTNRGPLSDAMDKASDENESDRTIETDVYDDYIERDRRDFINDSYEEEKPLYESYNSNVREPSRDDKEYRTAFIGLKTGSGLLKNNDYTGIQHVNLYLAGELDENTQVKIFLEYAWAPISQTNRYYYSIKNSVRILSAGMEVKYNTTPPHTFLGLNFYGGFTFKNYLYWKYKNPVVINESINGNTINRETISWDILSGNEIYFGTGINIAQFYDMNLGGYISPGLIFWDGATFHDFDNDVFKTFLYIKFGLVIEFKLHNFF